MKLRLGRLLCLVFVLTVSACGGVPTKGYLVLKKKAAKARPAYQRFQELCKAEDLPSLKEPLLIEGYMTASTYGRDCDRDGWAAIAEGKFEFFECSTESITDYKKLKKGIIYRYEIDKAHNGKCPVYEPVSDQYIKEYSGEISKGNCLVKKKINEPKSRYAMLYETGYVGENNQLILTNEINKNNDQIGFGGYVVIDITHSKLIAVLDRLHTYFPYENQRYLNYKCLYEARNGSWYLSNSD